MTDIAIYPKSRCRLLQRLFLYSKQGLPVLGGFNGLEVTVRIYFQLASSRIVQDENAIRDEAGEQTK